MANLYQRQNLFEIVNKASEHVFIPFTIGGGVRTVEDIRTLLHQGADKVAINTAATKTPELITKAAKMFGSQCIVVSIEAQRKDDGSYEVYTDNGRTSTNLEVVSWAKKAQELGAGEILLTSVEKEGTKKGLDINLIDEIVSTVSIPVIASGGVGSPNDILDCFLKTKASAVATASLLHYKMSDIEQIKLNLENAKIKIRKVNNPRRIEIAYDNRDITDINKYTKRHLTMRDETQKKTANIQELNAPIGIIDYGINNVKSVFKAFSKIGKKSCIINNPDDLKSVKALILPGVGAFKMGMESLKKHGFVDAIRDDVLNGKPILGICLGMQMLFSVSEEFGECQGLDLIKGKVIKLKSPDQVKDSNYRLPHIGWNQLQIGTRTWRNSLLNSTKKSDLLYFVHSYYPIVENKKDILATTRYGYQEICVVVKNKNVNGTQFHPEKSGSCGLRILKEFCNINQI